MNQVKIVEHVKGGELEGESVNFVDNRLAVFLLDLLFEVLDFLVGRVEGLVVEDPAPGGPGTEKV